eukprot:GHVT01009661.1.p1 GENE.GHVT01009661.1~~GHVT01009661.1.p1  ORF type:complete len:166 (+),score=47.60 GHVT01009661.1:445-942(+)
MARFGVVLAALLAVAVGPVMFASAAVGWLDDDDRRLQRAWASSTRTLPFMDQQQQLQQFWLSAGSEHAAGGFATHSPYIIALQNGDPVLSGQAATDEDASEAVDEADEELTGFAVARTLGRDSAAAADALKTPGLVSQANSLRAARLAAIEENPQLAGFGFLAAT